MSATVEIKTDVARDVLTVPIQAVAAREDTTAEGKDKPVQEIVFVLEGDKAKEVKVKSGLQDDAYIEVKEGLTEGTKVVSGPYNTITNVLRDGDMIKVEQEPAKKEKE